MVATATVLEVDERMERMAQRAYDAGCPRGQVENFIGGGYIPWPTMLAFHAACRLADRENGPSEIALGGSRGPGKSHAIMAQVGLDDCQRMPGLKVLFLRKVMKSASESLEDLTIKVFQYVPHETTLGRVSFPNGSRILLGGYKDERDIEKYLGIEYDLIVLEEATQITDGKVERLRGSKRSTKPGWRERMYLSTNADGIGLLWFKKTFVMPARDGRETDTRFFDVVYKDNPLLSSNYVNWLEGLKGPLGKAWRDADWDAFAGMAFPMWNYERHVVEPFEIPEHWVKWRAIDWGFAAPWCCLWFAKDTDTGRIYVYREAYQIELTDKMQAERILDMTLPGEQVQFTFADPSMWARKNKDNEIYSTADAYRDHGVTLTKADNDRIGGKRKVDTALSDIGDGEPGLQIFSTCMHTIEQLSTLARDTLKPEDVDTDQEDHAYDTLRYGLTNVKHTTRVRREHTKEAQDIFAGSKYM